MAGVDDGFLFADYFANSIPSEFAGVTKESPNFGVIALSDLLYAALLVFVLSSMAGTKTFGRGAVVGMVVGFGVTIHFDLLSHATTSLTTPPSIAANVAISMSGLAGGVIAAVLGRFDR